jgi:hypothetical protein
VPRLLLALALAGLVFPAAARAQGTVVDGTQEKTDLDGHAGVTAWLEDFGPGDANRLVLYQDGVVTYPAIRRVHVLARLGVGPSADGRPVVTYDRCRGFARRQRCAIHEFDPATGAERELPATRATGACHVSGYPSGAVLLLVVVPDDLFPGCRPAGVFRVEAGRRVRVGGVVGSLARGVPEQIVDFNSSSVLTIERARVVVRGLDGSARVVMRLARRGARAGQRAPTGSAPVEGVTFGEHGVLTADGTAYATLLDYATAASRILRRSAAPQAPLELGPRGCALDGPFAVHDDASIIVASFFEVRRLDSPAFAPGTLPRRVRGDCRTSAPAPRL